ncbi:hypothetical protein LJR016_000918 [Devosia sp. LjRoot16]|uniref:hypothetical protein n=1 Tax=Devosia sp. LjRoot16 TaxID=3342271 RepID=UPI003ECF74D8
MDMMPAKAGWGSIAAEMTVAPRSADVLSTGLVFDLLQNPFAILNLSPDATREDIVAAFDDGIADNSAPEGALREARRQLLAPKLRMLATVEFLPDATQHQREEAVAALRQSLPLPDLDALAKTLPAFSQAIFLSQLAQLGPSSAILGSFARSRAQSGRDTIATTVAELLMASGTPQPQGEAINEVIDEVTQRGADRLFVAYADANAAASDMVQCLNEELAQAATEQVGALGVVVEAYAKMALPDLQAARRKVEDVAEAIRKDPDLPGGIQSLTSVLHEWDAMAQPQQLLASHKGRDEGAARELFQFLRGLMLELANEHERPKTALEINEASLSVFAELPRAEQQLQEDRAALEGLAALEKLQELSAFVNNAKQNPDPLVDDLKQGGFGEGARGDAARLYGIFNKSLASTQGSPASEHVWGFVRDLALEINNEFDEVVASQRLIEGLHAHPGFREVSATMQAALETDLHTVRANAVHAKLNRAIQQSDRRQTKVHLAELVSITRDPADRQLYQKAIEEIDAANRRRAIKWVIWATIGLALIGYLLTSNGGRPYSTSSSSSASSTAEAMPLLGTSQPLNRANIRYCVYQNARLDAASQMLATETNGSVIDAFNRKADEYNSRCDDYRYYPEDLSAVQAELAIRRDALTAEGRNWVRIWRAQP